MTTEYSTEDTIIFTGSDADDAGDGDCGEQVQAFSDRNAGQHPRIGPQQFTL